MIQGMEDFKIHLQEIFDLRGAAAVLSWDQSTYMPGGGAAARGRQTALLARLSHEKQTDPALGRMLEKLEAQADNLSYDSDEAGLLRVARDNFDKASKIPNAFIAELNEHASESYQVWSAARPANDFKAVQPYLEKTLDISRRLANFFPGYESIMDPLIDFPDPGMKVSSVSKLFDELRQALVPMVLAIAEQDPLDDRCLFLAYPPESQIAYGSEVVKAFGYDFERGRQDMSPHPFTTSFSIGDVRITTRVKERDLREALFSTLHEAGHGMYEQGINAEFEGLPIADGSSSGVHESQSRLWENVVGRSRGFWSFQYPKLQAIFPDQLGKVSLDSFYGGINKVERSLIRTDADELTYNLHVMIRFDLELALLEGKLAVKDLPDAWNARYKQDLGIEPPDDRDGVLQDVHWYAGPIGGMFQGYTIGNVLSAQFYEAALDAHPEIPVEISEGKFETLHRWMKDQIYQYGKKYSADELVKRTTGGGIRVGPYLSYLHTKFGELYELG
ncbi:MAG: carboxypeptidase M32 [Anaerolineales bacterium]|nr:MAG: carboxypeptidase M32 [Anaerolineales bacterium]